MTNKRDINRKDKNPKDTIETIQELLRKVNLNTVITNEKSDNDVWYSVRVEIEGLAGMGSNGKGISREFALASAYAELMERIQSGFLLHQQVPLYFKKLNNYPSDCIVMSTNNVLEFRNNIGKEESRSDVYKETIEKYEECRYSIPYLNLTDNTIELVPEWFVKNECSSNGLCAGNTPEEALVQGICEVLERYVKKVIYDKDIAIPSVAKDDLKNLSSYSLISEVEKNGFDCIIKDCTLGGVFPVMGVLIVDSTKSKCFFGIGSDPDIDICIQRCITEIFQGRNLDRTFIRQMSTIVSREIIFQGKIDTYNDSMFLNSLLANIGQCPINFFEDNYDEKKVYFKAFLKKGFSNKEALRYLISIIKTNDRKIYIRDNSSLGFPSYRVYIPGYSELKDIKNYLLCQHDLQVFKNLFYNFNDLNIDEIKELVRTIVNLEQIPFSDVYGTIKMLNSTIFKRSNYIELFNDDIFLTLIYSYLGENKKAYERLFKFCSKNNKIYNSNQTGFNSTLIYLKGLSEGLDRERLIKMVSYFINDEDFYIFTAITNNDALMDMLKNLPSCPRCSECAIGSKCGYLSIAEHIKYINNFERNAALRQQQNKIYISKLLEQ